MGISFKDYLYLKDTSATGVYLSECNRVTTETKLTAAMTLTQPTITQFKGDPIEYKTFVMAFDAHICSKATTSADLLYYLNQHLESEPVDLTQGCLHMDPDAGYIEARRLLQKEYGDPYKISTAYLNKILHWDPIKFYGLKRLSIERPHQKKKGEWCNIFRKPC